MAANEVSRNPQVDFQRCLFHIKKQLSNDEITKMCFLCRDLIPISVLESIKNGFKLFEELKKQVLISSTDVSFLVELLEAIHRFDLVQIVQNYDGDNPAGVIKRINGFRYLLYDIAINCNSDILEDITHLASAYMTTNLANVKDAMHLFVEMEKQCVISQDDVSKLHDILGSNQHLINRVKVYERTRGIQVHSGDTTIPSTSNNAPANQQYLHGNTNHHLPRTTVTSPNQNSQNASGNNNGSQPGMPSHNPTGYSCTSHGLVVRLQNQMERQVLDNEKAPSQAQPEVNAKEPSSGLAPGSTQLPSLSASSVPATNSESTMPLVPTPPAPSSLHQQETNPSSSDSLLPISTTASSPASTTSISSSTCTATSPSARASATGSSATSKPHHQEGCKTQTSSQDDRAAIRAKRSAFLDKLEAGDATSVSQDSQLVDNELSEEDAILDLDAPGGDSAKINIQPYGTMRAEPEMPRYSMTSTPKGFCVIINNVDFSSSSRPLKERKGSDVDAAQLDLLFQDLGYLVTIKNNLSASEMYNLLNSYRECDHSNYDCFICCILTHGAQGVVYGCDGTSIQIKDLTGLFVGVKCGTLSGKPKVFFLQACQGPDLQEGVECDDPSTGSTMIPNETDFLVGYSTVPGYASLRDRKKGTWYISTLVQAIKLYHDKLDMLHILTTVSKHLGDCSTIGGLKQAPMQVSMLSKALYL